eukprot:TRINITY_DN11624_c0_g1_i2.p1 TRINITY_DN11624_c0_g1~~TRINITY_DN11624_c0_g1_i2.p1  ORF type:complete len:167 (+),score=19.11 TRINITY_DN11624_c0_g1_i2:58-501(+)
MATTSTPLSNISISLIYRASNCEGIASLPFHLPLVESVNRVIKALEVYGTVLIKAPPGSGKTSFIVRILSYLPYQEKIIAEHSPKKIITINPHRSRFPLSGSEEGDEKLHVTQKLVGKDITGSLTPFDFLLSFVSEGSTRTATPGRF